MTDADFDKLLDEYVNAREGWSALSDMYPATDLRTVEARARVDHAKRQLIMAARGWEDAP